MIQWTIVAIWHDDRPGDEHWAVEAIQRGGGRDLVHYETSMDLLSLFHGAVEHVVRHQGLEHPEIRR